MARLSKALLLLAVVPAGAALPPEQAEFFEKKIRPVLATECIECHGAQKQKGGLRLDYRDGWKKGGDTGDAIVPGNPAKSLLIQTIRHTDPDLAMPSKRPKLSDQVIANFEQWITWGAPDPRDEPAKNEGGVAWQTLLEERKKWWSLQPVRTTAPPIPRNTAWSENAIDRFLLAKMEAKGLEPGADTDARSLCRRIYFVVTGLPPSAKDVETFALEHAASPARSVEKLVDQLLASPQFGERWARHWMDLVRYAETHGSEGDPEIPNAWRYRDYLIRAFNDDVPWNELIREHLAGDLLSAPRWNRAEGWNESVLGTTHLRLVEHGYQPVDTRDEQVKVVENQIDVLGKAFQGMTFACARCHDHKFDAVSQRDYYALAGVMESSRPAIVTIDSPEILQRHSAEMAALKGKIKNALAESWLTQTGYFAERLLGVKERRASIAAAEASIAEQTRAIAELEAAVRSRVLAKRGLDVKHPLPFPIARWDFESTREEFGKLNGRLRGDAELDGGKLKLRGNGYFQTDPLGRSLREKSLEAWVTLANVEQAGGGVMTVEDFQGDNFDSIVFAEKTPRLWVAGSDFFRRSQIIKGPEEKPGRLVHMVLSFGSDGQTALYRNGEPYGEPWRNVAKEPATFAPDARVLFGLRHMGGKRNGYLIGEIEEARLYDRALSAEEAQASYAAGISLAAVSREDLAAACTPAELKMRSVAEEKRTSARAALAGLAPTGKDPWSEALDDAPKNQLNPLHSWETDLLKKSSDSTSPGPAWAYRHGPGITWAERGEFSILPTGDRAVSGLLPEGVATGLLTRKHGGIAATPHFQVTTNYISVRASGKDAQIRLILDGYPLPNGQIFPRATLKHDDTRWVTLDVKYRKGAHAYLEVATAEDLTRKEPGSSTDSWFSVGEIVFHDGPPPADPVFRNSGLDPSQSEPAKASAFASSARAAVLAWREGKLTDERERLLDFLVRKGLLTTEAARPWLADYRKLESEVSVPRRASGVMEGDSTDAKLLTRGDHHKPDGKVARAYLEVLGGRPFESKLSGRLELAEALVDPENPLTARVMVNRIWQSVFGRGLVPTPDNFGRMGEAPSHPELLDYLAARFSKEGWSAKRMIRSFILTRAFRLTSLPTEAAGQNDPENLYLSHFSLRRMEAEAIRDSLLALGGKLDPTLYGPPVGGNSRRRSIYLAVKRTSLNSFLQVFDAPKPFTTIGRRDSTNVPAQSLSLLNDPFVIECAEQFSAKLLQENPSSPEAGVESLFSAALSRPPTAEETRACKQLLATWGLEKNPQRAWRDLAQTIFNLKEFVYLR